MGQTGDSNDGGRLVQGEREEGSEDSTRKVWLSIESRADGRRTKNYFEGSLGMHNGNSTYTGLNILQGYNMIVFWLYYAC